MGIRSDDGRARALDAEAELLERFADARYEGAARDFRAGTRAFYTTLDTADEHRRRAAELRSAAKDLRAGIGTGPQVASEGDYYAEMRAQIVSQLTRTEKDDG